MPIHPLLLPGYEAFRKKEYVQALIAWEEPWKALTGDDRRLALALVRLAGALHHERDGRRDSSFELYESGRDVLAGLPASVLGVDVARLRRELPATVDLALAAPPQLRPAPRIPRHILLRFLTLVAIVGTGAALLRWSPLAKSLDKDAVLALFDSLRDAWWAPALLVLSYVVLCPLGVPATPMVIAGGMVWGVVWGSLYNVVGSVLGGAATYYLGRHLGRDFVLHIFGKRVRRGRADGRPARRLLEPGGDPLHPAPLRPGELLRRLRRHPAQPLPLLHRPGSHADRPRLHLLRAHPSPSGARPALGSADSARSGDAAAPLSDVPAPRLAGAQKGKKDTGWHWSDGSGGGIL